MSTHGRVIRITANFERNLEEIRRFLAGQEAAHAFDALVTQLFDSAFPNLDRFPEIGRDFLVRSPISIEGQVLWEKAHRLAGARRQLREYITDNYLVLYAVSDDEIALLSIKHHRQLSFDLKGHWT